MINRKYSALFMALVLLSGCASLGLPTAKTFNERAAVAYGTVTSVRTTTLALLQAGKITAADAGNVQKQADNAREAIDLARSVADTNPGAADTKLAAAVTILNVLNTYLGSKK